jgi:hypothetical protein
VLISVTCKMGVLVRHSATQAHLQVGPFKNENVHPHRQELLEKSRNFRRSRASPNWAAF